MKDLLFLFFYFFLFSCKPSYDNGNDLPIPKPLIGKPSYADFVVFQDLKIVEEKMGDESNFYLEKSAKKYFLINYRPYYYSENLKKAEFDSSGNYVYFYLDKSDRYKGKNRLILFEISEENPKIFFEIRDSKVERPGFEQEVFVFYNQDGKKKEIALK